MGITFLPQTRHGRNAALLGLILLIFFGTIKLMAYFQGIIADPSLANDPVVVIPKIGTVLVAIVTFVTGLVAIFKSYDRSVVVIMVTLLSFLLLALKEFLIG